MLPSGTQDCVQNARPLPGVHQPFEKRPDTGSASQLLSEAGAALRPTATCVRPSD